MGNLLIAYGYFHRQCGDTVRTMHHEVFWCIITQIGQGRTHVDLDTLCHTLTDSHIMLTAHILLNISIQVVTSHLDTRVGHNTTERDHGNLSRTTTDIHNHITLRSLHIDTNTDSGSHRLKNQIDVTTIGMFGRVAHSTQLHFRRTRGNTDHHTQRG